MELQRVGQDWATEQQHWVPVRVPAADDSAENKFKLLALTGQ